MKDPFGSSLSVSSSNVEIRPLQRAFHKTTASFDILLVINDKDSIPPPQRPWPSAAVDRFRVPADSGLTAPLIAQANRACPALNIFIAPTSSALER